MKSTTLKRWDNSKRMAHIRQNHSCEILPRFMVNTHSNSLKIAEITVSWLFWEFSYSNYAPLQCFTCKN